MDGEWKYLCFQEAFLGFVHSFIKTKKKRITSESKFLCLLETNTDYVGNKCEEGELCQQAQLAAGTQPQITDGPERVRQMPHEGGLHCLGVSCSILLVFRWK